MEGAYAYIQPIKENTLPRLVYDPKKLNETSFVKNH
jgi:hypothetical protein